MGEFREGQGRGSRTRTDDVLSNLIFGDKRREPQGGAHERMRQNDRSNTDRGSIDRGNFPSIPGLTPRTVRPQDGDRHLPRVEFPDLRPIVRSGDRNPQQSRPQVHENDKRVSPGGHPHRENDPRVSPGQRFRENDHRVQPGGHPYRQNDQHVPPGTNPYRQNEHRHDSNPNFRQRKPDAKDIIGGIARDLLLGPQNLRPGGYRPGFQPPFDLRIQPGYNPGFDPHYQPGYDPRYQPQYDPRYQPGYDRRNQPQYDPRYQPPHDFQPGYNPGAYPRDYYPNHVPQDRFTPNGPIRNLLRQGLSELRNNPQGFENLVNNLGALSQDMRFNVDQERRELSLGMDFTKVYDMLSEKQGTPQNPEVRRVLAGLDSVQINPDALALNWKSEQLVALDQQGANKDLRLLLGGGTNRTTLNIQSSETALRLSNIQGLEAVDPSGRRMRIHGLDVDATDPANPKGTITIDNPIARPEQLPPGTPWPEQVGVPIPITTEQQKQAVPDLVRQIHSLRTAAINGDLGQMLSSVDPQQLMATIELLKPQPQPGPMVPEPPRPGLGPEVPPPPVPGIEPELPPPPVPGIKPEIPPPPLPGIEPDAGRMTDTELPPPPPPPPAGVHPDSVPRRDVPPVPTRRIEGAVDFLNVIPPSRQSRDVSKETGTLPLKPGVTRELFLQKYPHLVGVPTDKTAKPASANPPIEKQTVEKNGPEKLFSTIFADADQQSPFIQNFKSKVNDQNFRKDLESISKTLNRFDVNKTEKSITVGMDYSKVYDTVAEPGKAKPEVRQFLTGLQSVTVTPDQLRLNFNGPNRLPMEGDGLNKADLWMGTVNNSTTFDLQTSEKSLTLKNIKGLQAEVIALGKKLNVHEVNIDTSSGAPVAMAIVDNPFDKPPFLSDALWQPTMSFPIELGKTAQEQADVAARLPQTLKTIHAMRQNAQSGDMAERLGKLTKENIIEMLRFQ